MNPIDRRRLLLTAFAIAIPCGLAAGARAAPGATADRVVIQVSDGTPQSWNLALNNARNIQLQLGAEAQVEIVAYGPGIGMLKADSPVAARIAEALSGRVRVNACQATMKGQKLTEADMLPGVGYVPSGVVELMRRQQEGYAYIRP